MGLDTLAADQAVRFDQVVRHQGGFTLGPLDLRVPVGMVTGFVGPNGAGKTTAIKAMLSMVKISSGRIQVLGDGPGAHHDRIGVVLDTMSLPLDWTAWAAATNLARFYPTWDQPGFTDLLDRLDVPRDVKVKDLSRGQGVKLQLALALAHRPELLILDEPTSGLDPVARLEVLDIFREFMLDEHHTILFSTHITSDLERIADYLHLIGNGQTCYAGLLAELGEEWGIARGPADAFSPAAREALVGARSTSGGALEGLVRLDDSARFGPQVLIEAPALDEAVAALTRKER